jgi:hypothetical protein
MKLVPILIVIVVATAGASPYRPQPDEVLERLPTAILAGGARSISFGPS